MENRNPIKQKNADSAVSPVIGELLVLAAAVIILGIFAATLNTYIPDSRPLSVNVRMKEIPDQYQIIFYHKGGDPVPDRLLRAIIFYPDGMQVNPGLAGLDSDDDKDGFFNLSSKRIITLSRDNYEKIQNGTIRLVAGNRTVIFSGVVYEG